MAAPTLRILVLTAALAAANLSVVRAEPIPEPTGLLKDFAGQGAVVIDIPADAVQTSGGGGKKLVEGLRLWVPMEQYYVRPDRIYLGYTVLGQAKATLIQTNTERSYTPGFGYVIVRSYRNMERAAENPMSDSRLSMATLGKALRELKTGKLLPAEDLDKLKEQNKTRIEELEAARAKIKDSPKAEDRAKYGDLSLEMARLRDDIEQVDIRRAHPCHIVEFQNKDLLPNLLTRGLVGDQVTGILAKGVTTVWVTKAEGLPVKLVTRANDGRAAITFTFTRLKINSDMKPGDLALPAPPGTQQIEVVGDLLDKDWEDKMEASLQKQVDLIESAKRKAQPSLARPRKK